MTSPARRPRVVVLGPTSQGSPADTDADAARHGGPSYRALADDLLSPHADVTHLSWSAEEPLDERTSRLDALLPDTAAVVTMPWLLLSAQDSPVFDRERLSAASGLRVIAGTHDFRLAWVDLEAAAERDVAVVDTSRTMTPTVAEYAVGMTFALLRRIPEAIDVVRRGGWMPATDSPGHIFRDLADCRVGLAGYGSINRHYRRFIRPYGGEVSTFDPLVDDAMLAGDDLARASSLEALAGGSDVFVVAIPPTPSTLRIVDRAVIEQLPTGSLFVLLSRMAVVEQEALWERARAGELRVGVDVFDPEPPPPDAWFRTAPNVLPTPHIAGNVRFAHERCFREACVDAVRVLTGKAPQHAVAARDSRFYEGSIDWVYG